MIQDQQSYRIQIIKPWFRFYLKGSRLQLKLRGPTIHIFKCYELKQIPKLPDILVNYFPYEQQNQIVTFDSIIECPDLSHQPLKKILSQFFQRLVICYASWLKEKNHIATIQKKLKQLSGQVRIYVRNSNKNYLENNVFIYFPNNEGIKNRIIDCLEFSQRFQNMTVMYPLNSFIDRKIDNKYREFFVYKFLELYRLQIQNIPKKNSQIYKYLQIKNIEPIHIPRQQIAYTPENWVKQQSKGIYGLKIQLIGHQYEIIKFYSSLQLFLRRIRYCVKESSYDFNSQNYKQTKYQNKMLKCFYLNKTQYVIFGPPELFQIAFEEIQKHQWTVTKQNYPNMSFQIIKKKGKKFRKQLVQQKIVCEQLIINQEHISFLSNRKNYEKIKYFTGQFICAHLEVQIKLDFIKESYQFHCLKQYLLVNDPFYENIELKWCKDYAYVICNDQRTKETYNQLKQNYEQCMRSMACILSTKSVEHPLVKVMKVSHDYLVQNFIQRKIIFQGLNLQINFKNLLASEEDYAVLMAPNIKNKDQLQFILERNFDILKNEKLQFIEIFRPSSKDVKSIVIWNYNSHSHRIRHYNEESYQPSLDSLLQIVNQRQKLVFLVTKELIQLDFQSLISILEVVPHYQCQICRKVDILLSNTLKNQQKRLVYGKIRSFLRQQFAEEPIQQYQIKQSDMPYISQLKLYQMFFKIDKNSDKLQCSNLNSFIVSREIQAIERNQRSRIKFCGLFLPNSLDLVEILVDLHKMKAYIIENNKVKHFNLKKMHLEDMINLLRQMLPDQSYIVLYAQQGEENILSALYIYSPATRNQVRRYKLKRNSKGKFEFVPSDIVHKIYLKKCEQQVFFQLQTHRNYIEELKKKIK